MSVPAVQLDGSALPIDLVVAVARDRRPVALAKTARARVEPARAIVESAAGGKEPVYGINTGFGSLSQHRIPADDVRAVQRNLIRSHAAGVGEPLPEEAVRAMLLILAASLSRGHSGVRPVLIECLVDVLNAGITPVVPSRGSVGASGDLAPLAHAVLVLIGEGEAWLEGERLPGAEALRRADLDPITLQAKEGLALINGTHLMTGLGSLAIADVDRVLRAGVGAAAMAVDACRGTDTTLDARLHEARCQPGQRRIAELMRTLLSRSSILTAHVQDDPRVQDPYSLRAAPQVMGAACDAIEFVRSVITRELGAVTDNPLVFTDATKGQSASPRTHDSSIVSGGNFHGMPLAIALDTLKIALCHIAGIAERRINWLLTASDSENPVNIYLSPQPGLHSGLMITQYTAAACCAELQTLATPASVSNISTSAGIEDYNSMGATAALQVRHAVELVRQVVAIELLVMTEAMEYQRPLRSGDGVERVCALVRSAVPPLTEDRPPAPDIEAIASLIARGAFDELVRLD